MNPFEDSGTMIAVGSLGAPGLLLSALLETDIGSTSGARYPISYADFPAATVVFARERPAVRPLRLLGVGTWLLASSISLAASPFERTRLAGGLVASR